MGLKSRAGEQRLRRQLSVSLDQAEDEAVWERARAQAREWDVTIKSLVLDALAEYLLNHPEKPT